MGAAPSGLRCLSIRQPWASLIVGGLPVFEITDSQSINLKGFALKDVENRMRPTRFRGRVQIHAGLTQAPFMETFKWFVEKGVAPIIALALLSPQLPRGAIVGEVDIIDCVTESDSPWFVGPYGWVLANPEAYDKPIPCKGRLGFFTPDLESLPKPVRA